MQISYIPLTSSDPQKFFITINGVQYFFFISWCNAKKYPHYNLDIYYDSLKTDPVVCGIPLVADWGLTNQLRYLGLNFGMVVGDPALGGELELGDLGVSHVIYIGVESEDE
jgi:hypothetical protein